MNGVSIHTADEQAEARQEQIPVIDLFAGPGGLGEGFSSLIGEHGERRFALKVSIEKDPVAHQTLSLRALYRAFPKNKVPECYFQYVRGEISRETLFAHPSVPDGARKAAEEARLAELGKIDPAIVDGWISSALKGGEEWVLIGGPPCQAYSLAGRSRRTREDTAEFEKDVKHFLYKEYLRIIQRFRPTVFVMENVKGILSSKHGGSPIFGRILEDLSNPEDGLAYEIRSFVVSGDSRDLNQGDFVIKSEQYGVPQSRHRVILFGIRSDVAAGIPELRDDPGRFTLTPVEGAVSVESILGDLPRLRSRLSKEADSPEAWRAAVSKAVTQLHGWDSPANPKISGAMASAAARASELESHGGKLVQVRDADCMMPNELKSWYINDRIKGVLQHETRSHMRTDIYRYLFASCYAKEFGYSPKLSQFPPGLLPNHENVHGENVPFEDRFRVQLGQYPSSTVVAHIAKDGHYFIHPDPSQCRSLTVREAARLQTFPDDYFFEGNRTEQYTQVGNAVPPWLARKIALVVSDLLSCSRDP